MAAVEEGVVVVEAEVEDQIGGPAFRGAWMLSRQCM